MLCRRLLAVLFLCFTTTSAFAGTYTEDFTTTTFQDTAITTAAWDTTSGELKLPPFVPTLRGNYDTSGDAYDVAVAGDLAFVADNISGLKVIDISNPASPTLAGTYNTPGFSRGVAVAGNLAFVADGSPGLQVIDISNPVSPTLAGTYNTPGYARGVAVAGNLAFVADSDSGLQVIDISDPSSPTLAGTYNTPAYAYEVVVAGDLAFVADYTSGLQVVDISNPSSPTLAGTYNTPGYAVSVTMAGDLAFVADYTSGLQVIDISDPSLPTLAGTYITPGYARGVAVAGDLAFVADHDFGLQVIGISDPSPPTFAGIFYNYPLEPVRVAVAGDLAFVTDLGFGLQVIDISDPSSATLAGTYITPGSAEGVAVAGDLAFVADYTSGLQVIDISDPSSPSLAGTYDTPGHARGVAVAGDLAFVADGTSGLQVIDISDPSSPSLAGTYNTPGSANFVAVAGDLAFVGDFSGGLQVVDISNPSSPTLAGTYNTVGYAAGVAVAGDLAFVACGSSGLQVIDISDPSSPTLAGAYITPGLATGVAVAGDLAFVADLDSGLQVVDISDPSTPTLAGTYNTPGTAWDVAVAGDLAFVADWNGGLQVIQVYQHEFMLADNIGRSIPVDNATDTILRARITSLQTADVAWELSADGGSSFQSFAPGADWSAFTVPGADLHWRTTHTLATADVNPAVSEATIEWLNEFAAIATITDVPDDQGGWVRLALHPSGHDFADEPSIFVTGYQLYRRVDNAALLAQINAAETLTPRDNPDGSSFPTLGNTELRRLGQRTFAVEPPSAMTGTFPAGTWELLSFQAASQQSDYTVLVPTQGDSATTGTNWTVYFATTHTQNPLVWFASPPDSGYSVDNIAPGVPQQFAAAYGAGSVALSWDPAPEPDFQYFRVYRSPDPGFVPGPGTLVHETATTSWQDSPADPGGVFYKLTALDHVGNESDPASSGSVTAVGDGFGSPTVFALRGAKPNPLRAGTRIAFDLPDDASVSLEVFDVAGRLVRTLARETLPGGTHEIAWDGADDIGHKVAAGVYLYRLRAGSFAAARRMVVIR